MPVLNTTALITDRVDAIRGYHDQARVSRAELDLSGGVDSAVMAGLLVKALGPENVTLAHTNINTNPEQTRRAEVLATALGCTVAVGDFSRIYADLVDEVTRSLVAAGYDSDEIGGRVEGDKTILGSIRSTLRAPLGRAYNRITGGGIRHGTGNECEDRFLRFYQKGGDGEVDTNPLAMLSKGEVYQLAFALGQDFGGVAVTAFRAIIKATPSPDLWGEGDGHSDEAELLAWTGAPFTYGRIDPDTGALTSIGTIERVARFLDTPISKLIIGDTRVESVLFHDAGEPDWVSLVTRGKVEGCFEPETRRSDVETLLMAARQTERITRHKFNPNCPTLGDRKSLVEKGILTNNLSL